MLDQERLSGVSPMELNERERVQEVCRQRLPALGQSVKQPERPVGPLVEHRSGGGQQQKAPIRGTGRYSLLGDRKSTRLNSSHVEISYAVFCLKKKKKTKTLPPTIKKNTTTPRCT